MRQIGVIETDAGAQRFADYLLTVGVSTRLEAKNGGWAVWVREEEHVARAAEELRQFTLHPNDARYLEAERAAAGLRRDEQRRDSQYRKNVVDLRTRGAAPRHGTPLTAVLLAACVMVFMLQMGRDRQGVESVLLISLQPADGGWGLVEVRSGQVWRLVTPIFMHGGWAHLIVNSIFLIQLGGAVEARRGTGRFAGMVLLLAVGSNLAQYYAAGPFFLGMSGVGFGLFGYAWMKSRLDPAAGLYVSPNTVFWMLLWFGFCFTPAFSRTFGSEVANWAHSAGLALGCLLGAARRV